MRLALASVVLLGSAVAGFGQDDALDVAAELARIAALPTAKERAQGAAVLARKPGVDVESVLAAIAQPRDFPEAAPGSSRERVTLTVDGEAIVVRWKGRTVKRRPKADVGLLIKDWVERLDPGFLPVAELKL